MLRCGMEFSELPPEDLIDSLAFTLLSQRKALQRFGRRPGHDDRHAMAIALVEHLKRSGVEKVMRRVNGSHSWPPAK